MTKSFVALIVIIALTVEPVTAGMLYSGLSDADAASIKRMGVVSALGDTLMIRSMGLTIFNNKKFKATLSNRDFDESFGARMKGTIAASGKVRGEVAILTTPSLETESLIAAAREQGFDAIVAMQPAEDTQFHMTGPGLTVFRSGGGQKAFTCNSMRIVVIRIADAKQLASASDYQCPSFFKPSVLARNMARIYG